MNILSKFRFFCQPFFIIRAVKCSFNIHYHRFLFRLNGISFGRNMRIYNKMYLMKHIDSSCAIGDNFKFVSGDNFNPLARNVYGSIYIGSGGGHLTIGNNVGVSSSCIWCSKSVTIGNNVKIGCGCIILDTDSHSLDFMDRRESRLDHTNTNRQPIVIENDVLIGTHSIILKGVTIGARSIIGAGSVVTKDIPSDCIAAGNPCRVIKRINNE